MEQITVLIVDDHSVVREGLQYMLQRDEGVQVVGEAADGLQALDQVQSLSPQVVLMDIHMPNMDGLETTRRLKEAFPTTSVIMLTMYDDDGYVVDAVQAGAAGYLLKDVSRDLLSHTIAAAAGGGTLIKTSLLRRALDGLAGNGPNPHPPAPSLSTPDPEHLTSREEEVLAQMVEGKSNKEIGSALSIVEDTVKKHVQNIIAKLGASDRTHAVVKAMRAGLVK